MLYLGGFSLRIPIIYVAHKPFYLISATSAMGTIWLCAKLGGVTLLSYHSL